MCTVSVIPLRFASPRGHDPVHGFRLVTNRDEIRSRAVAVPPRWHTLPASGVGARALFPTDSAAGGTWVGVAESGLVLCLLNGNPRPYPGLPPASALMSRGVIVPSLLDSHDAEHAAARASGLDLGALAPFALLAVDLPREGRDGPRVFRVDWDRNTLRTSDYPAKPVCAVSSGLGDHLVRPRLALFDRLLSEHGPRPEVQDRFHRHVWPDRPEISVMMSRRDARTVSVTMVEVIAAGPASPARIGMRYLPIEEGGAYGSPVIHRVPVAGSTPLRVHARATTVAAAAAAG